MEFDGTEYGMRTISNLIPQEVWNMLSVNARSEIMSVFFTKRTKDDYGWSEIQQLFEESL